MNISTYHPLQSFDLLAIGIALVVVMVVIGFRVMTGRSAGPFNRPPLPEDDSLFPPTRNTRPRAATPAVGANARLSADTNTAEPATQNTAQAAEQKTAQRAVNDQENTS